MTTTVQSDVQTKFPLPDSFSEELTTLFTRVQPSIVQVYTEGRGGGTGVIWQDDGRIITNNHVVPSDDAQVKISLFDGRTLNARVLQRNPDLDLALLQISGDGLQSLPFAESSQLRIGEWVFAIGHPWGQRWVITSGIVSTMSSAHVRHHASVPYIKSDVGLAPGNSGGPLLNADGAVVGINSMILGGDLSVAIPSSAINAWLANLPKGFVTLGIELLPVELPEQISQSLQPVRKTGLLIAGLPAREERLKDLFIGDILLAVAGKPVSAASAVRQLLNQGQVGNTVSLTILRGENIFTADISTQRQQLAA
jgi:serine protease Do